MKVQLGGRIPRFALVDDEDFDRVNAMAWQYQGGGGYAFRSDTGLGMHRFILDAPSGVEVDHRNGDPLDNRRENLRLATTSQNQMNARKCSTPTSSIYKGVHWEPDRSKWGARIKADGKYLRLGRFNDEAEAALAYNAAAILHFGEFARLNEVV